MQVDLMTLARVVAAVAMALAAYAVGKWRGREEGFGAALLGMATGKIKFHGVTLKDMEDVGDMDELADILRSFEEDDDE